MKEDSLFVLVRIQLCRGAIEQFAHQKHTGTSAEHSLSVPFGAPRAEPRGRGFSRNG